MAQDTLNGLNLYAVFRFALAYPDEQRLDLFRRATGGAPQTLEDLRSLYIALFEAGMPHPRCPLLESYYVPNRPATEVVLENKLFYKHFGLNAQSSAAPDHLLTQLEFLSWIEYLLAAGHRDPESLQHAKRDFLERHVNHWLPCAARLLRRANGGCYVELFELLATALEKEESHAIHSCF